MTPWHFLMRDDRLVPRTLETPTELRAGTLEEWEQRRNVLLEHLRFWTGPDLSGEDWQVHDLGHTQYEEFGIRRIALELVDGFYVAANLYVPDTEGRLPAILHPHGHWPNGRFEDSALASVPARCINLALRGYVSLTYDMIGYGDTRQLGHRLAAAEHGETVRSGVSLLGVQVQAGLRFLDYLCDLPFVDETRIGCTGASGGGSQTILLSALDERIAVTAPVNMISATCQGWCLCENAPALRVGTHNLEIAALTAPRPMLVVSCTGDWTTNTPRVEYPQLRSLYELYGTPRNVQNVHVDADHNYNMSSRQAVYRWFDSWFYAVADEPHYLEIPFPTPERSVLSCEMADLPKANDDTIRSRLLSIARHDATTAMRSPEDLRERLSMIVRGADESASRYSPVLERRDEFARSIVLRARDAQRHVALRVLGEGADAATSAVIIACDNADKLAPLFTSLPPVRAAILVEPFSSAGWATPAGRIGRSPYAPFFLTYNRSDLAEQVLDIWAAIDYVARDMAMDAELLAGVGEMSLAATVAAALSDAVPSVVVDDLYPMGRTASDTQAGAEGSFIPGWDRLGGVEGVGRCLEGRRVTVLCRNVDSAHACQALAASSGAETKRGHTFTRELLEDLLTAASAGGEH